MMLHGTWLSAYRLGVATYLIDGDSASNPGFEAGRGKLADLRPWLESINLSTLEPSFKSREAILGIDRFARFIDLEIAQRGIGMVPDRIHCSGL